MEFVQNMVFCNLFTARPYTQQLRALVLQCLFDEQYEVRNVASVTLSGFYQCGFIPMTDGDFVSCSNFLNVYDLIDEIHVCLELLFADESNLLLH